MIDELKQFAENFDASAEGYGFALRLQFANLIIDHLKQKQWSQQKLANASGLKPAQISRVINAEANCTFETVGRVMHTLGIKPQLIINPVMTATDDVIAKIGGYHWDTSNQTNPGDLYVADA